MWRASVVVVVAATVALASPPPQHARTRHGSPMLFPSQLGGYDLPSTAAAIIEEIDGAPPAPAYYEDAVSAPGSGSIEPDRRGEAAVVVGLNATGGAGWGNYNYFTAAISVGGQQYVEGELSTAALYQGDEHLFAPIPIASGRPLRVEIQQAPGESTTDTVTIQAQVLYGSLEAIREVCRRLGVARWWGRFAEQGAVTTLTKTVNVAHGGRAQYGWAQSTGTLGVELSLNGRSITPSTLTSTQSGKAFLPLVLEDGDILSIDQDTTVTDESFYGYHGRTYDEGFIP